MILKVGTVFSGIGAPEQALKELNINHSVKWACDIDKFAKQTYLANHSCEKWYDNVTKINISELSPVDLFCYGFPCLDISCAGKQDLTKGRSILVNYCLDITDKIQPKYFVFENVKALLSNKFKDFFNFIISRLSVNYNIYYKILNSKNYGVPQNRERVFCVGIRKDINQNFEFPEPVDLQVVLKDLLDKEADEKYFLKGSWLEWWNKNKDRELKKKFSSLDSEIAICQKARQFSNWRGNFVTNRLFSLNSGGQGDRVYSSNSISVCLSSNGGGRGAKTGLYLIDEKIRRLTPRECARLQGFPESFKILVSDTQAYKQFGNTITVNVLKEIFKKLLV